MYTRLLPFFHCLINYGPDHKNKYLLEKKHFYYSIFYAIKYTDLLKYYQYLPINYAGNKLSI